MNLRHLPAAFALLGATAAHAADGTYADLTSFLAAAGGTSFESFESLPGRSRSLAPISTALLTVSTTSAPIGVQTGADTPDPGYGSHAVDGNHYVSVYLPNVPQGSIRINFAAPTTAFGLYLTDIGETSGQIVLSSNVGAFSGGISVEGDSRPDGNTRFLAFTQSQAFTQVTLTVTGVDEAYGLDKVYVSAVPEPASAALFGLGLAGLWAAVRRRR